MVHGPYWKHLEEAWKYRNHPNFHLIYFEDLKTNTMEELKKLNTFLNTNISEEQLEKIAKYTSFSEMKARTKQLGYDHTEDSLVNAEVAKKEGGFFRKGGIFLKIFLIIAILFS